MAANVLNSPQAVEMSVLVVRAFVRMRQVLAAHKELAQKLTELERRIGTHDEQIQLIFEAIRQLMAPPAVKRKPIGFVVRERTLRYQIVISFTSAFREFPKSCNPPVKRITATSYDSRSFPVA